ncbi:peptidase U32 family protein [Melioribacter sp. OK-6-Me]|uniref:peptidase U32 family protein n=1 Tax=unclassified Melioribacter TaxID=2627329 RepID=UPI003ED9AF0A
MANKKPELLAPAGDWSMLNAAIKAGANAIYLGVESLNMRALAKNFELEELPEIVKHCKNNNVDVHLTLNTIVYENELNELEMIVKRAKEAGVDLIIGWDFAVIQLCKKYNVPFCISTQASVSNSVSAEFFRQLGAKRIVLARECSLEQVKEIKNKVDIEIEAFIHGAMCIAISGRCFMSHEVFNKSANRGECLQPCRREYEIKDSDEKFSMILGENYVLSPKDLCTIDFIELLIEAGIDAFKIEGRKRSPEYIYNVVSAYRKAIDLYYENKLDEEIKTDLKSKLSEVYNRGFSSGFYLGTPTSKDYAEAYGNLATTRKKFVGRVINYYNKNKVAHIFIDAEQLEPGDKLYIIGNTTGVVELEINSMLKDDKPINRAAKGDDITIYCEEKVRENDKVYKIVRTN